MKPIDYILSPLSQETFIEDYFEKKHLHITGRPSDYFDQLINMDVINNFLSEKILYHPDTKMVKLIDNEVKTAPITLLNSNVVDSKIMTKYFDLGYTLVMNALHNKITSLWGYSNFMSDYFGSTFQTNIYITPGGEQRGFNIHHDTHDVFVTQIDGEKKWQFFESPIKLPNTDQKFVPEEHIPGPMIDEIILKPGDTLYVPRGLMHCAVSTGKKSTHITGGLMNLTWKDLMMERITNLAQEHPVLRETFKPGYWKGNDLKKSQEKLQEILGLINTPESLESGLSNLRDFTMNNVQPRNESPLETCQKLDHIYINSNISIKENLIYRISSDEENVTIHMYHQKVELPVDFLPIIDFIDQNKNFTLANLPDILENEDKIEFVKSLVIEGFLTV